MRRRRPPIGFRAGNRTLSDLQEIAESLSGAFPQLDPQDQQIAISLYRLLAGGRPVSPAEVATASGATEARVANLLDTWPAVFRDGEGGVVGFWGLTVVKMPPHQLEASGVKLWAWCAWNTLFLPELLDTTLQVKSVCPGSQETIELRVAPDRVESVAPQNVVVSFLRPDEPFDSDVITSFCHFVHFFTSPELGEQWVQEHPGTFDIAAGRFRTRSPLQSPVRKRRWLARWRTWNCARSEPSAPPPGWFLGCYS